MREAACLLRLYLKEKNQFPPGTRSVFYRYRENEFLTFFIMHQDFIYWNDIKGLMAAIKCEYSTVGWRLSINCSKPSLKYVVLDNGCVWFYIDWTLCIGKGKSQLYENNAWKYSVLWTQLDLFSVMYLLNKHLQAV